MKKTVVGAVFAGLLFVLFATAARGAPKRASQSAAVKRGEYLVTIGGCNDCHTPWKMGPNGPVQDMSRMLSGHPDSLVMPPAPRPNGPWAVNVAGTFTAWSGPWGVSFTQNLTPDKETGLGNWTVQNFIEAMRTGRHQGRGRQILPPMPWQNYGKMPDEDLRAVFAYLQSIPPIHNRVPDPIPPEAAPAQAGAGAPSAPSTGSGSTPPSGGSTGAGGEAAPQPQPSR